MRRKQDQSVNPDPIFFEALEPRTYFDLVPIAISGVPAVAVAQQHTTAAVFVELQNTGASPIRGAYTITLLASPDGATDNATTILTKNELLRTLNPNATRAIRVPIGTFPAVTSGDYHIVAQIGGALAGVSDNVVSSSQTVSISTPFIDLSDAIKFVGPTTIDGGRIFGLLVTVTNNGNALARGPLQFQLGTSPNSDGSAGTMLNTPTRQLILPAGRSRNFLFVERLPLATTPGTIFADVTVDPSNTFNETDTTNNFAVTPTSVMIQSPFHNILGAAAGTFNDFLGPNHGTTGTLTLNTTTEDNTNGDITGTATDSLNDNFTFTGTVSQFGIVTLNTTNTGDNITGTLRGLILDNGATLDGIFRQSNGDLETINLMLPTET